MSFPSAANLVEEAIRKSRTADINLIHSTSYELMLNYKTKYYAQKIDTFLSTLDIEPELRKEIRQKMLTPIVANGVEYSNFMEEASRRISQVFQPISGNIAELCAERDLIRIGLRKGLHYRKKAERADIVVYYPDAYKPKSKHRVEVKNVKLRERGTRGLIFDGDSLFGFFDDPREFTQSNCEIIDMNCNQSKGYCYLPPITLSKIQYRTERFKENTKFGEDISFFIKNGYLP